MPPGLLKREVFTGHLTIMNTGLDSEISWGRSLGGRGEGGCQKMRGKMIIVIKVFKGIL